MKNRNYNNKKYAYQIFTKLIMYLFLNNINIINKYMHIFDISIVINNNIILNKFYMVSIYQIIYYIKYPCFLLGWLKC